MADAVSLAGWRWLRCYDAGLGEYVCDLCGTEIGGVFHHVRHDDYPDGLLVGPKCGRIVLDSEDADLAEAHSLSGQRHDAGRARPAYTPRLALKSLLVAETTWRGLTAGWTR